MCQETSHRRRLDQIMNRYQHSFSLKEFDVIDGGDDALMNAFCVTSEMKEENKQYWGRELGACWERLVISIFEPLEGYSARVMEGQDEICDLVYDNDAIDTKYRVGSGDSGTLKKFRQNATKITDVYDQRPVMLFLREDNLDAAFRSIQRSGWHTLTGDASFEYIREHSGFDLEEYLLDNDGSFSIL